MIVYGVVNAASNLRSLFLAQDLSTALGACHFSILFAWVMVDLNRPPKGLAGVEWLYTQGARSEDRYERASGSTHSNPEMNDQMRGVAKRSRIEPKADSSEPWQQEMREYSHCVQRPLNFDPTRMLFYCDGRPCVVQREIYPSKVLRVGDGLEFTANVFR